ncbi:MAG: squalene/phytoene synthase family protein [Planctomycetota bacterium]
MSEVCELNRLLSLTSRTFALSIPRLPEPLRRQVGIGYLVFRIADTIEDEGVADPPQRVAALRKLKQALDDRDADAIDRLLRSWNADHGPDDDGYAELLGRGRWVYEQLNALDATARGHIRAYVGRTIDGMAERLLAPSDITDVPGVQAYCYHVAGIVGEMLTDLFVNHHAPLRDCRAELMELSRCFGETLQLVNILRDHGIDLDAGRRYVPDDAAYTELLCLAERDCTQAQRYLDVLGAAGAPDGVVEFNAFNLHLAEATLQLIRTQGPGAKVSREVVADTMRHVEAGRQTPGA